MPLDLPSHALAAPKRRYHIVSSVKNEGPYLIEWIAYHRALGVREFTIFHNDCDDGTARMLERLAELDLVTRIGHRVKAGRSPQLIALRKAWRRPDVQAADWLIVIDIDEFINIHCGARDLDALIDTVGEDADAICMNWKFMGSNGHRTFEDVPVTERFPGGNRAGIGESPRLREVKTMFRPEQFDRIDLHVPRNAPQTPERMWMNGSGERLIDGFLPNGFTARRTSIGTALVELNHYAIRSREEFLMKRQRGSAFPANAKTFRDGTRFNWDYWCIADQSHDSSRPIPIEAMQQERQALLADPKLARLHARAVEIHKERIDALYETPAFAPFLNGAPPPGGLHRMLRKSYHFARRRIRGGPDFG